MTTPILYTCHSIENNWPHRRARYDGVHVAWFVRTRSPDRTERGAAHYGDIKDRRTRSVIEEAFTADEALAFAAYMRKQHESDVKIEPQEWPVPPAAAIHDTIDVAVDVADNFHMLALEEGYTLPFSVWGHYNVRDCKLSKRQPGYDVGAGLTEWQLVQLFSRLSVDEQSAVKTLMTSASGWEAVDGELINTRSISSDTDDDIPF